MTDNKNEYEIGYRKPPKATQFKPGKSGNPKGRKKQPASVSQQLSKILSQKISVTENGVTKKLSRQEIMLLTLANNAAKGDLKAVGVLLNLLDSHQDQKSPIIDPSLLDKDSEEIIKGFLAKQNKGEERVSQKVDTPKEEVTEPTLDIQFTDDPIHENKEEGGSS